MRRQKFGRLVILIFALALAGGACGQEKGADSGSVWGDLSVQVVWHETALDISAAEELSGVARVTQKVAPVGVTQVNISLVGKSIPKIYRSFDAALNKGTIYQIPVGTGYTIIVQGLDDDNNIISSGVITDVKIYAGTTNIYRLDAWPTLDGAKTGNLKVTCNTGRESFEILGPQNLQGSGASVEYTALVVGRYTIFWNDVSGYERPAPETFDLAEGATLTIIGEYAITITTTTTTIPELNTDTDI